MKNKDEISKQNSSKTFLFFTIITIVIIVFVATIFLYFSFASNADNNLKLLQKEAKNIEIIISESFDYTNQINNHIGKKIAQHNAKNLKFILKLFHEADEIKNRNIDLFSWSSFDWVDNQNHQVVNSRLGIRKDAPDMSQRQYTRLSPQKPWTLQLSFPTIGNPSKSFVIPAGTGIVDKNNKYLGAVVVGFNIEEFGIQINQKSKNISSFIILDKDLRVILKSNDVKLDRDSAFFMENFNSNHFRKKEEVFVKEIKIGDVVFKYYKNFDKYPYIILTGFNKSFFSQQFHTLILPRLLEFVCLTFFFLIILYLFKTKIFILLNNETLLRKSLQKVNEAKDNILASIAHDIKNYVFGINGLSKLILDKKQQQEILENKDLQMIETISSHSEELLEFVKDLLDSNQVEAGEFNLGKILECDLVPLLERVVTMNSGFAIRNSVMLKTNIENNLPKFQCDPRRIKQILNNLITNSIKYSKPQTIVTIDVKFLKELDKIFIEIADCGFGMNEKEIEKYLSGNGKEIDKSAISKHKKIDSHGIGMSIVLHLIKLHQGSIEVKSEKNIGTKVKLYFNIKAFENLVQEHKHNILSDSRQTKKTIQRKSILLVEDNSVNILINRRILESEGYQVYCAENGQEALEILDKQDFDLILMDGEMPIMNGYDATRAIRDGRVFTRFKNYKTIPIIALMSSSDDKTVKRAIDCGMNAHIEKSPSKTALLNKIRASLR
jgi:signal transduction histidine kinase/CheY-like chemotaxis protein